MRLQRCHGRKQNTTPTPFPTVHERQGGGDRERREKREKREEREKLEVADGGKQARSTKRNTVDKALRATQRKKKTT